MADNRKRFLALAMQIGRALDRNNFESCRQCSIRVYPCKSVVKPNCRLPPIRVDSRQFAVPPCGVLPGFRGFTGATGSEVSDREGRPACPRHGQDAHATWHGHLARGFAACVPVTVDAP